MGKDRAVPGIEVDPQRLVEAAARMRAACAAARLVQRAAGEVSPAVTGSAALADALGHHGQAWRATLEAVDDRLREAGAALAAAGRTYDWVESCLAGHDPGA